MSGRRLARSVGVISVATLASRVLGLARDVVQGAFFGTSAAADAFAVATRIPSLLRDLFAEGAMSAAFVPTLTRYLQRDGRAAAWRLGSQVINGLVVCTGLLVLVGLLFTPSLVSYYAAAYAGTPKFDLTVALTRITLPFLMLVAVAAAIMGMLNSLRRFFVPALSPAIFNVVFIACALVLVPTFARIGVEPILALAVAMLLGGVAQILVQWPLLRGEGYRHQWVLNPRDQGLREVLLLMGPGAVGVAAAQINLLVNTWLATQEAGAPAALGYAFRLMYMPIGLIGVSVATAAIPEIARFASGSDHAGMRATLSRGMRLMLMLGVPATVGLMTLASPIVELIYQWGQFDEVSTSMVADSLVFYAPGIVGYSIVKIASPTFYSLRDARTPVVVSLITISANLALNLWLNSVMGFKGLALGTAIAASINAGLLLVLLSRRLGGLEARRVAWSFVKILVASGLMGVAVWWTEAGLLERLPASDLAARLARVGGGIGVGIGTLALAAWALRIEEFRPVARSVTGRLRGPQDPGS